MKEWITKCNHFHSLYPSKDIVLSLCNSRTLFCFGFFLIKSAWGRILNPFFLSCGHCLGFKLIPLHLFCLSGVWGGVKEKRFSLWVFYSTIGKIWSVLIILFIKDVATVKNTKQHSLWKFKKLCIFTKKLQSPAPQRGCLHLFQQFHTVVVSWALTAAAFACLVPAPRCRFTLLLKV